LIEQALRFCRDVAGSSHITAACIYGDDTPDVGSEKTAVEVLLVIRGLPSKLVHRVKVAGDRTMIAVGVDEWVFERDVERGFLGEALAWGLIFPYLPLINKDYLHVQEVKLKKRLIQELMENLVLDYPELSYELCIKPEYFMYEAMMSRARLFPPMLSDLWDFMRKDHNEENVDHALRGYSEALRKLEQEGVISLSNGYVKMSGKFVNNARSPKIRIVNLSKAFPRTLFTSFLGILPRILNIVSQSRETVLKWQRDTVVSSKIDYQIEVPGKYVYLPTASGLVPLANKTSIKAFAREVLHAGKDVAITVKTIGGILNNVYLVEASGRDEGKKVVVKQFKDWSSFKWFPLALWSVGTRTFAVLGRPRLERECAINQLLYSKGFAVPRLLYVSPDERLVFMEYVDGENVSKIVRRIANSKTAKEAKKELKIVERIGRKFAKVHALSIALGDTKPENIMIGKNSEIYLMDFEQSSRNGDMVWDVAEFLFYAGHGIPPLVEIQRAELIAKAFVSGYLEGGGKAETIRKAANPKYTKVFSVFTLPHVMLAISNICRKAENLKE